MYDDNVKTVCSPQQWQTVLRYVDMVRAINVRVNLVSRKDADHVLERHVAPSFTFKILNRIHDKEKILDIGSGGGFPGIINAILFPGCEFLLVDSTKKKVAALQKMINALGLKNVQAIWSRVEDLDNTAYGRIFDRTTSRAVAPLRDLVRWSTPLLRPGGTIEALKGGDLSKELTQVHLPYTVYHVPNSQLAIISIQV